MAAAEVMLEQEEQLVAFRLAGETYGVPIMCVHEIIRICDITRIPHTPEYVRGVVNLRGKIVPVLDLRSRLGLPVEEKSDGNRIIVVETAQGVVGMIVDAVSEVLRLPANQVEPPSDLVSNVERSLIRGVGKREKDLVVLLDIDRTLRIHE